MRNVILVLFWSICIIKANAQDQHEWRTLQNQGENFRVIQQKMEAKYAGKSSNKRSPNYSRPYKQYKRWEYYWKSRVNERGQFVGAEQTYQEAKILARRTTARSAAANWTILGPTTLPTSSISAYGGMGRINAIAWESGNTNILYAGSPSGGLWKSTNGGTAWVPLTDNEITLGVSDIVVSHADANTIYLATGDANGQQNASIGILKSTNGGSTWSQTGLTFPKSSTVQTARIVQHPTNANTLLATSTNGIHKTTDGGANWSTVYNNPAHDLEYDPNNAMIMYASKNNDVLKSTDGGNTWNAIATNSNITGRIELGLTKANSNVIIGVDAAGGAIKSTDGGGTWTALSSFSSLGFSSQGGYNIAVAIAPTDQNLMMVGGVNGFRSTDGGTTWEKYLDGYWETGNPYFYVHSDHHVFKFLPNSTTMITGNDGGVHRGDASASTPWTDLSSGLAITQYYGLAVDPTNTGTILAGAQDNDVGQFNGTTWFNRVGPADGIEAMIDPSNPTMVQYASIQQGGLTRTDDGWASEINISPPANGCGFVWPMVMDPATPTTIYAGCDEIYKSTNKGDSWAAITSGQSNGNVYTRVAIAPSNANIIYASYGTANMVVTTNGGTSWTTLTVPGGGFDELTGIAVAPTNPQKLWVTYAGYTGGDKVFLSTDGGNNWTNISGSLPNIPVKCVVAQSGSNNEDVYIGTDLGVFHRNNTLSDWQAYSTGLPNVIVNDLEITYSNNKLRAATFGRGVWESDLNTVIASNTALNDKKEAFTYTVAPNPTTGIVTLNIQSSNEEMYGITVYNLIGGVVYHQENMTNGQHTIDLSNVANGMYMVSIATKESIQTQKIELAK